MMEPDLEIQVETTVALNGSSAPNASASEKKTDEKNLTREAKFIQVTSNAEETKDEKKKGVDIDKANDETNIAEEKNGEDDAKPEFKAEVEVKVNDKGNNTEVENHVEEEKDEDKLKVNEEITKTDEKKDGTGNSGEEETHGESNSNGDIKEICDVENMKKTEEKDDTNKVVKEVKEVENENTREVEDNKVDETNTENAEKVGEGTIEAEVKAKDDLEITDIEENRNEIQHVEVREGRSETKMDEEREDISDTKRDEERGDNIVIKKDEREDKREDKHSFEDEFIAGKAGEEISKEEKLTEAEASVGDDVEMMDVEENNLEIKNNEEREDDGSDIKKDVEREENFSEIRKAEEREGRADNGNEDVEMAEADDDSIEKQDGEITQKVNNYNGGLKKKRSRSGLKISGKVSKEKKNEPKEMEKEESMKEQKELKLTSPTPSSTERPSRPVRERKTVERLVEVIEKEPIKSVVIEKGQGIPLKDIPKVAYRLARKQPGDLKLLHQILFGRIGKAVDFKNNLLKFSGFVRHESDEKQRAKVKERLEKCVNENLIGFCEILNIYLSKTKDKKEDLITKLLDFLAAPYVASSILPSAVDQGTPKSHKRDAKGSASKSSNDTAVKSSNKKGSASIRNSKDKSKGNEEDEDELNESENGNEYEREGKDEETNAIINNPIEETKADDENSDKVFARKKKNDDLAKKNSTAKLDIKEKPSTKSEPKALKSERKKKSAPKSNPKIEPKDVVNDDGEKVFFRKRRNANRLESELEGKSASKLEPKVTSTSKPESRAKSASKSKPKGASTSKSESINESVSKSESKEKTIHKKSTGKSNPSKEELRMTICDILKQVDFNTATFTDILNRLCKHYKTDLTPRKISIKLIIQEELTKLANEMEDEEESSEEEDHNPKIKRAKV